MADTEFEEFRQVFEKLPQNSKTPAPFYSLVPVLDEDYISSKSESSDQDEDDKTLEILQIQPQPPPPSLQLMNNTQTNSVNLLNKPLSNHLNQITNNKICTEYNNGGNEGNSASSRITTTTTTVIPAVNNTNLSGNNNDGGTDIIPMLTNHLDKTTTFPNSSGGFERKRRKLPEIPKVKKPIVFPFHMSGGNNSQSILHHHHNHHGSQQTIHQNFQSLADELNGGVGISGITGITAGSICGRPLNSNLNFPQRSLLTLKCSYLLDEDSSPDSERLHSLGDVDSGHSTSHSPNDYKSMSPQNASSPTSPFPPPFGGVPMSQLEMLEATHRGLHKFTPRHHDEIEIEIGDPIYVQKEADDLWCEGVNLRTGRQGIFPSAYAVDLDYNDFDPSTVQVKKERFLLGYLGSVETIAHKGTGVVCQAVRKISEEYGDSPKAQPCILEVSDQGLRMVDRSKPHNKREKGACIDYFYSLKNVSFCAFHPRDHRYIGFITKHPTVQRFACHVFRGHESTRPVAESVGRAFQRFYQKFIETAYPIEDIYIE